MKRLLLFLAACGSSSPPPCERACDHVVDLMKAQLEDHLTRAADHSDPASAEHMRETGATERANARAQCLARCTPSAASCLLSAPDVATAESCR